MKKRVPSVRVVIRVNPLSSGIVELSSWVILPAVSILPIELMPGSVKKSEPSIPVVIESGDAFDGRASAAGNRERTPVGVIRFDVGPAQFGEPEVVVRPERDRRRAGGRRILVELGDRALSGDLADESAVLLGEIERTVRGRGDAGGVPRPGSGPR